MGDDVSKDESEDGGVARGEFDKRIDGDEVEATFGEMLEVSLDVSGMMAELDGRLIDAAEGETNAMVVNEGASAELVGEAELFSGDN